MSAEISFFSSARQLVSMNSLPTFCSVRSFHLPKSTGFPLSKTPNHHLNAQQWTPIFPVPQQQRILNLMNEPQLSYIMRGRKEVARYPYLRSDGRLLGYVVRLEDEDGKKITPTLTFCKNKDGQRQWRFQGFGDNRPLYGMDILKNNPENPVLVVEGEKTCDAARKIFKSYVVTTWSGGCLSVHKSNWKVLKGRKVTIWPDHDKAGKDAGLQIADIVYDLVESLSIVDLPPTLPPNWDLADPLPRGLTYTGLMKRGVHISRWF